MTDDLTNFDGLEFAENPDPRCPVVLVLDCSDSMTQEMEGENRTPMEALNGGLDTLYTHLNRDPLAQRRAEVSFVLYGTDVQPATDFKTAENLVLPELTQLGITSTGAALVEALDTIEERKKEYKSNGVQYYRPILMLISDGLATDDTSEATRRLQEAHEQKKVNFMPIAVEGADVDKLTALSGKTALRLSGLKFEELFEWLSASAASVSSSQPGDKVTAPAPDEWMEL